MRDNNPISFRPASSVKATLDAVRMSGNNVSDFINAAVSYFDGRTFTDRWESHVRFISSSRDRGRENEYKPLGELSIPAMSDLMNMIAKSGYGYYRYQISGDADYTIFAANRMAADNEFSRYYTADGENVSRTIVPLPRMEYNRRVHSLRITTFWPKFVELENNTDNE